MSDTSLTISLQESSKCIFSNCSPEMERHAWHRRYAIFDSQGKKHCKDILSSRKSSGESVCVLDDVFPVLLSFLASAATIFEYGCDVNNAQKECRQSIKHSMWFFCLCHPSIRTDKLQCKINQFYFFPYQPSPWHVYVRIREFLWHMLCHLLLNNELLTDISCIVKKAAPYDPAPEVKVDEGFFLGFIVFT